MIVKPASAIGGPPVVGKSRVYAVFEDGARRSMWFEYEAADCHVEVVAADVGHIPPKM